MVGNSTGAARSHVTKKNNQRIIDELHRARELSDQHIDKLDKEIEELEQEIEQLNQRLEELEEKVSNLEEKVLDLEIDLTDAEGRAESELEAKRDLRQKLEGEAQTRETFVTELQDTVKRLERDLVVAEERHQSELQKLNQEQARHNHPPNMETQKKLDELNAQHEQEKADLEAQIGTLSSEKDNLLNEITSLRAQTAKLTDDIASLRAENAELHSSNCIRDTEPTFQPQAFDAEKSLYRERFPFVTSNQDGIWKLNQLNHLILTEIQVEEEIKKASLAKQNAEKGLPETKLAYENARKDLRKLIQGVSDLEGHVSLLKTMRHKLAQSPDVEPGLVDKWVEERYLRDSAMLDNQKKQTEELRTKSKDLEAELSEKRAKIVEADTIKKTMDQQQAEIEKLKAELGTAQTQAQAAEAEARSKMAELEKMQREITEAKSVLKGLEEQKHQEQQAALSRIQKCTPTAFYEILGLVKKASVDDVKKAYRRLSLLVHPDKVKNQEAEAVFKMVCRAYKVLMNPKQKEQYDAWGGVPDAIFDKYY